MKENICKTKLFVSICEKEKKRDFYINMLLEGKNKLKNKFNLIGQDKLIKNTNTDNKINKLLDRKNKIIQNRNVIKNNILIINLLIIINLIIKILSNNNKFHFIEYKYSKIALKIKGFGEKKIYNNFFHDINKIKEVYINGINQTIVKNIYNFNEIDNLIELIFEDYITSCAYMFEDCSNISEIDLSNFNSLKVTKMYCMFSSCTSLISINFTNFTTSFVDEMNYMFYKCNSLISLDLSSFDTSKVTNMDSMFSHCKSLSFLNLSNFHTPKVETIDYMFHYCTNLEYINLRNFVTNNIESSLLPFDMISANPVICIDQNNTILRAELEYDNDCYTIECSEDWKSKQKKIVNNKCIDSCANSAQYNYEYNGKCIDNCTNGYFIENTIKKCKCELEKCFTCPPVAFSNNLCTKCNEDMGYYPKENDPTNMGDYFDCYINPEGYYLDNLIYKKCYNSCKFCKNKGNNIEHNCTECNSNFTLEINYKYYKNCYNNCEYYYYFDNERNYYCTNNSICPNEYHLFNNTYCIKDDINNVVISAESFDEKKESQNLELFTDINIEEKKSSTTIIKTQKITQNYDIKDIIQNISDIINNEIKEKENEVQYYDNIIHNFEKLITSNNYNISKIINGKDEVMEDGKIKIILTTNNNQKKYINKNITLIDLLDCETSIRNHYNISDNDILFIKKIEVIQDKMKIPKIEYDIYYPFSDDHLTKLNTSTICQNDKISLSIPLILNESLDKLNSSSGYYNDICYLATSDSGTDILLKDRKNEFIEGNKTVCQEDCEFYYYNDSSHKANCLCIVKGSSNSFADIYINKTKLNNNFDDIKNKIDFSNLRITSCDVLNSKENIEKNPGFFLLLIILAIFIIAFIIFYIKGYNLLSIKIDKVIFKKFKHEAVEKKENNNIINKIKKPKKKNKNKTGKKSHDKKKASIDKNNSTNKFMNKIKIKSNDSDIDKEKNKKNINKKPINTILKPDTDYELNMLSYKEAIIYDKRTSCDYYASLIKNKQLIIFTFCAFNDYNSNIIKKVVFFISFALHYTVNALFFTDSSMHQIYEDEGNFNFSYQFPYIIFSAIISTIIIRLMLEFLIITDKDILTVKLQTTKIKAINMKEKKLKYIKIKFSIFFVLNLILLVLFWYYLTCFNAIYRNTQTYLIENTFISFGISLVYPFVINILPMIIRMNSIHSSTKNNQYSYKFSQIIQLI